MRHAGLALQIFIVSGAIALAVAPLSPAFVERYYAGWFYPRLQASLTSWSNTTAFSLFDVLAGVVGLAFVIASARAIGRARRQRSFVPIALGVWQTVVAAAAIYVWFALTWGLNYARPPIEGVIGYDAARVTADALRALAERATVEVNRAYTPAHQAGFPEIGDMPAALVSSLHRVEAHLGRRMPTTPGRPKRTLLAHFFRASGVDGMHAPFLLETLLNPDLTPPERPAVLAHEWAHMAGYAPEADASFVGLLAALHADPASRYSAWLFLFDHSVGQLPRAEQRDFVARLDAGVQADRRAISERLQARVDVVARASWETYDHYLKAQGVDEGIASYSRVVELLLGADALNWP
jgi:hypothetical protein